MGFRGCNQPRNDALSLFCPLRYYLKMFWRKLVSHRKWFQLGIVIGVTPVALWAEAAMPAALPEDLIPELKTLLESAMTQSPSMLAANLDVAAAEGSRYIDRSSMLPAVFASGGYAWTQTAIASGQNSKSQTEGLNYNLSFGQPIFQWGALKAQADIGKLRVRIAERSYADAFRLLSGSIRTGYLGLIQKKMYLRNQRSNVRAAEAFLSLQEAKKQGGLISEADIVGPRLAVDEARIAAEKTQEDYESSARILARLAGVGEISDQSIPLSIPKPVFAAETIGSFFDEMKRTGIENVPLLQVYRDYVRQGELNYRIAKVRLYPKFRFDASVAQSNQTSVNGNQATLTAITTRNAGFSASWSIFDGLATRGAKLSALATKRLYEQRLKTFQETTLETAHSLEKQIGFAGRLMDLAELRNTLAQAAVSKVKNDVESGVSSTATLEAVTQAAQTAELTALSTRAEFLGRWADYVSLLGVDPILKNIPSRYLRNGK